MVIINQLITNNTPILYNKTMLTKSTFICVYIDIVQISIFNRLAISNT